MARTFDDILLQGIRSGKVPSRTKKARAWYREKGKNLTVGRGPLLASGIDTQTTPANIKVGGMYYFYYSPKWKKTLPYYDTSPLIFVVGPAPKGFYGLNFHYLDLRSRAKLMDALYKVTTDKRFDENTRLRISYDLLKGASKYRYFRPTFKHYLKGHVKSRMMEIYPVEWDIALFMPVANFVKATESEVWEDSKKIIKGHKRSWWRR